MRVTSRIIAVSIFVGFISSQSFAANRVFTPVTGPWYPKKSAELSAVVNQYLDAAKTEKDTSLIRGIISPHAGYEYSGQCAAYAFKQLKGKPYKNVIIIGPSHHTYFRGVKLLDYDEYQTPLGLIKINTGIVKSLVAGQLIAVDPEPFVQEHSTDNMMPFLQTVLKDFTIVPIIVGEVSREDCEEIGRAIRAKCDNSTLIVISSDFTHYGPNYEYTPFSNSNHVRDDISNLDHQAIDKIVNLEGNEFDRYISKTSATICGRNAIRLLMPILSPSSKGHLLDYYQSGDLVKDYTNTVSYAAIVFE